MRVPPSFVLAAAAAFAACSFGGPSADPAADRTAFLALECAQIRDARLRDTCLVFVTEQTPTRADELCPVVTDPALRDECWFVQVDSRELVGAEAVRACRAAGRFAGACHGNAISREVSRLPAMELPALTAAIEAIVLQYRQPKPGEAAGMARRRAASGG